MCRSQTSFASIVGISSMGVVRNYSRPIKWKLAAYPPCRVNSVGVCAARYILDKGEQVPIYHPWRGPRGRFASTLLTLSRGLGIKCRYDPLHVVACTLRARRLRLLVLCELLYALEPLPALLATVFVCGHRCSSSRRGRPSPAALRTVFTDAVFTPDRYGTQYPAPGNSLPCPSMGQGLASGRFYREDLP